MAKPRFCEAFDCKRKTPFTPTHDGAKYCCVQCKNRTNYILSNLEYEWELLRFKERKRSIKILEYLVSSGNWRVTHDLLVQMGFVFEVTYIPFTAADGSQHMRFGNCYLKYLNEDEYQIIYINN